MEVCVLGAGVIGITTAWFLQKAGYQVIVIDRQPAAGLETSFANGGQISVSHAEPWANPKVLAKILKWLGKEDAPLLFRLQADWMQWLWGLRFLQECSPDRTRHNLIQLLNLGLYSRSTLQTLRAETGITYDCLTKGILHFYTNSQEFASAIGAAKVMQEYGCDRQVISTNEAIAIEPALHQIQNKIVGATYTAADESGDAHQFTQNLAALCQQRGVKFLFNTHIHALEATTGKIDGVQISHPHGTRETLKPDICVLALGSFSPFLVRSLGLHLEIYPVKGYSVTLPIQNMDLAYTTSLTDDEYKLVFSRLGSRLRIAGTAEVNNYGLELNQARTQAIVNRAMEIFPGVADPSLAQFWTGLRPSTPSNVPYIGKTRYSNLFVNTGHGTLGWTHACGSGRSLAQIISGQQPDVDFQFTQTL